VLAAQQRRSLDGETAQDDVLGVDDVPLTGDVRRLGAERAHGVTFSFLGVAFWVTDKLVGAREEPAGHIDTLG
jgi:hypothetical protein